MTGRDASTVRAAPPDCPALLEWDSRSGRLRVRYHGGTILTGFAKSATGDPVSVSVDVRETQGVEQHMTLQSAATTVALEATIRAGLDSFPCEVDRCSDREPVVRHSVGLSRSLLNRAVYDRGGDWALSVAAGPDAQLIPERPKATVQPYRLKAKGGAIALTFRPRYYSRHRGLKHFEPWKTASWNRPVVGWSSWYAYFAQVTETDVKKATDALARRLAPFGLEYIQVDDGFQQPIMAGPEAWCVANSQFPSGLEDLARHISGKGLKPAIWSMIGVAERSNWRGGGAKDLVLEHKDMFVLDKEGEPAENVYVGYSLDGSNPAAIETFVRPTYRRLRDMGWSYFKVDALRHLRYEGYNSNPEYFAKKGVDLIQTYRNVVKAIREEIGPDMFLLACWGVRPELAGLVDGCRLAGDGFKWACLAQYNSYNNVVWRNDPDHIELGKDTAYRDCMVTSLTGSLFMLTDKAEAYDTVNLEPAVRAIPVPVTRPGQIYDVDPSRSSRIGEEDGVTSGEGACVIDGVRDTDCGLFILEESTPFENWVVLGVVVPHDQRPIRFADLGLDAGKTYLVFDFWRKALVGGFKGAFTPAPFDPAFNCGLYGIREQLDRPQIVSTNRHITQGGVDLVAVEWKSRALKGRSNVVRGDRYELVIRVPPGYGLKSAQFDGMPAAMAADGELARLSFTPAASGSVDWSIVFLETKRGASPP